MKADFELMGKRMPYTEPDGYVDRLVDQCAENALASRHSTRLSVRRHIGIAATAIAAAMLAAAIIFPVTFGNDNGGITTESIAQSQPLDVVLSSLSNDDLAAINYYTFDDMPTDEYDE